MKCRQRQISRHFFLICTGHKHRRCCDISLKAIVFLNRRQNTYFYFTCFWLFDIIVIMKFDGKKIYQIVMSKKSLDFKPQICNLTKRIKWDNRIKFSLEFTNSVIRNQFSNPFPSFTILESLLRIIISIGQWLQNKSLKEFDFRDFLRVQTYMTATGFSLQSLALRGLRVPMNH